MTIEEIYARLQRAVNELLALKQSYNADINNCQQQIEADN